MSKVEKFAPKFTEVKEKLAVYGNNTYDPSEHPDYRDRLLAIADAAVVNIDRP